MPRDFLGSRPFSTELELSDTFDDSGDLNREAESPCVDTVSEKENSNEEAASSGWMKAHGKPASRKRL